METVKRGVRVALPMCVFITVLIAEGCSREPAWKAVNDRVIAEQGVEVREREMPETGITPSLQPGEIVSRDDLAAVELAPGVSARMYWDKGVLVAWTTLEPGAEIPRETLQNERLMVVWDGSVEQLVNGAYVTMGAGQTTTNWSSTPYRNFVYITSGTENAVRADDEGATILEVYWPVRLDYVAKAGGDVPSSPQDVGFATVPSFPPNEVLNYYDIQFTPLSESREASARLINGSGFQCGFLSVLPGGASPYEAQPEEALMIVLRGSVDETVMDRETRIEPGDICYLPSGMVHRSVSGNVGCDIIDIFWPPRPDLIESQQAVRDRYHEFIPEGAEVQLVHDGETMEPRLNFTEGPAWMNGSLYFSNMWFAGDWSAGDPARSNTIRMDAGGTMHIIASGMQTNGIMPLGNGNLAVCDMFGHRIIDMTPQGGVVRTLASEWNGVRLDGPNDLVIDAKGGIYFTDPQVTPGLELAQPGQQVFYRKPDGEIIRLIEPGVFGRPNGILLSPDGKTLYINNTRGLPVGEYLAAYDVNEDGTIANQRLVCKLMISPLVVDQGDIATGADGMTIDSEGNIYVATTMGLQIVDKDGNFVGIVNFPIRPVSACFGGEDNRTIYCTCNTRIYSIRTNKTGLVYPLGQ